MKNNQPVTQVERPFPTGKYVVSNTDLKGSITYANDAFVELSGFDRDELIGKNHNVVRHPDMPPAAFKYLWDTIQDGRPWRGVVKNRCKNGDHYWVDAFVVPVREGDKLVGYMSVRSEPTREQVKQAEALYKQLAASGATIDAKGPWTRRISLRARLVGVMLFMAAMIVGGATIGVGGISVTNDDLKSAYEDHLRPSLAVARMVERMGDTRAQILLGIQHNPASPVAKLHEHPADIHFEAMRRNAEALDALAAEHARHTGSAEEEKLAAAFATARDALVRDGFVPAREALKAGEFDNAAALVMTKIDPLYAEVAARGEVLAQNLVESGEKEFKASQERYGLIRTFSIAGTALSLLLVAVAGFFLTRAIIDPLRRAIAHFDRISQNVLTDEIDISHQDEAGQLMNGLARMQVHLKVMLDQLRAESIAMDEQCRQLSREMNEVVEHSREQRDRVQEVAATTEQFIESVAEVAESAGKAAETAMQSRGLVATSTIDISSSMDATARVVDAVQASSGSIGDLSRAIEKIGEITQTIKEIADQTNLLALNAAIEAARAGEQGRGFAVVADEVRKLAERTAASTNDITATVEEFRKVTESAVGAMNQAVSEVEQGVGQMRSSVGGLDRITASSDDVADRAGHIAAAARQQAAASEGVAANMETISSLIDRNTSVAVEAWQTVEALTRSAGALMEMVQKFELVKRR